jgi:hypothetical protein
VLCRTGWNLKIKDRAFPWYIVLRLSTISLNWRYGKESKSKVTTCKSHSNLGCRKSNPCCVWEHWLWWWNVGWYDFHHSHSNGLILSKVWKNYKPSRTYQSIVARIFFYITVLSEWVIGWSVGCWSLRLPLHRNCGIQKQ